MRVVVGRLGYRLPEGQDVAKRVPVQRRWGFDGCVVVARLWRKEAREEAKRIFKKFTAGGPSPPPEDTHLEERVGDMERKLGETRATLQERVTAVEAMETTGRQALEARVLELEMRVPNLVALQERIDNVELSIARLAAIEEQVASGSKLSSRRMS